MLDSKTKIIENPQKGLYQIGFLASELWSAKWWLQAQQHLRDKYPHTLVWFSKIIIRIGWN